MALLHHAKLQPSKLELIAGWLPTQPWFTRASTTGGTVDVSKVASFRFDDPAGEVGIETLVVRVGGDLLVQVPLTYRAAPLAGAEQWLVGTMEHSVLGTRWTYDGCGDPVYATVLAETIIAGGTEAEQYYEVDGARETKRDTTHVRGSGRPGTAVAPLAELTAIAEGAGRPDAVTVIQSHECRLVVARFPSASVVGPDDANEPGVQTLTGTWDGLDAPAVLATARIHDWQSLPN